MISEAKLTDLQKQFLREIAEVFRSGGSEITNFSANVHGHPNYEDLSLKFVEVENGPWKHLSLNSFSRITVFPKK